MSNYHYRVNVEAMQVTEQSLDAIAEWLGATGHEINELGNLAMFSMPAGSWPFKSEQPYQFGQLIGGWIVKGAPKMLHPIRLDDEEFRAIYESVETT